MKQLATALLLLLCVVFISAQTCRPATGFYLSLAICLNLDDIQERIQELPFEPFGQSGVTVSDVVIQQFEPVTTGCLLKLNDNLDMVFTLHVNSFEVTGNIRRKRAFKVRRGTFRATGSNSDVTCTIPSNGSGRCVIPERTTCTVDYSGGYNVDFTGRLLGIIAKRRIASGIQTEIPKALATGVELVVNEALDQFRSG